MEEAKLKKQPKHQLYFQPDLQLGVSSHLTLLAKQKKTAVTGWGFQESS